MTTTREQIDSIAPGQQIAGLLVVKGDLVKAESWIVMETHEIGRIGQHG